jgi:hypothetical protein
MHLDLFHFKTCNIPPASSSAPIDLNLASGNMILQTCYWRATLPTLQPTCFRADAPSCSEFYEVRTQITKFRILGAESRRLAILLLS